MGVSPGLQSGNYRSTPSGFGPDRSLDGAEGGPPFGPISENGTMITGGGSGATTSIYIHAHFDALLKRARWDHTALFWDFDGSSSTVDGSSDVCLVFLNTAASEGVDRPALRDDFSDALVNDIAAQCNNTIVITHNARLRLADQWIDHPNVTALIYGKLHG